MKLFAMLLVRRMAVFTAMVLPIVVAFVEVVNDGDMSAVCAGEGVAEFAHHPQQQSQAQSEREIAVRFLGL